MKLEDQVISESDAVKLKSLGIIQKSLFYHHPAFSRPVFGETLIIEFGKKYKKTQVCNDKKVSASAFTVAELGVMLPAGYDTMYCINIGWRGYGLDGKDFVGPFDTEAECRAVMVLELIHKGVITPNECNKNIQ